MRRQVLWLLMAAAMLCSAGCSWFSGKPAELVAQGQPTIADVPLPEGFYVAAERKSLGGGARFADYRFKGRSDYFAVCRFYQRQMPSAQWTMVRDMSMDKSTSMEFDKGSERCSITVSKGDWWYKTYIRVVISPVGAMNRPSEPQAPTPPGS